MEKLAAVCVALFIAGLYVLRLMQYYKLKKELREVKVCNRELSIQLQKGANGKPSVKSTGNPRPSHNIPGRVHQPRRVAQG